MKNNQEQQDFSFDESNEDIDCLLRETGLNVQQSKSCCFEND
jgi:hypothetical protein